MPDQRQRRRKAWLTTLTVFEGHGDPGDPLLRTFGESQLPSLTYRNDDRPERYGALGRAGGYFGSFRLCGRRDKGAKVIANIMGRVAPSPAGPSAGESPCRCAPRT